MAKVNTEEETHNDDIVTHQIGFTAFPAPILAPPPPVALPSFSTHGEIAIILPVPAPIPPPPPVVAQSQLNNSIACGSEIATESTEATKIKMREKFSEEVRQKIIPNTDKIAQHEQLLADAAGV